MRAAGEFPAGVAAGAIVPAAPVAVVGVAVAPVTDALRSIVAKSPPAGVAVVAGVVVTGAGAVAPPRSEFSWAMRAETLSRLISSLHRSLGADL
jgi:hypothetical protein